MMVRILIAFTVCLAGLSPGAAASQAHAAHAIAAAGLTIPPAMREADPYAHSHAAKSGEAGQGGHASALGKPGHGSKVTRTIAVDMNDKMRFNPGNVRVKRGETIRFVVTNSGKLRHEMVIGSIKELEEHAEMMRKMPGAAHADENAVSAEPGKSGELIWEFTKGGKVDFACFEPGHYEAGMKGTVVVK